MTKLVLPDEQYVLGPDSNPQLGVPEGKVSEFWVPRSKTYPGFKHRVWLYIPAQYTGKEAIPIMVFLDGTDFVARDGAFRVPVVLNNLIARKELPVMAAIFVDPGESARRTEYEKSSDGSPLLWETYLASRFNNRSVEYEAVSSRYAGFIDGEVLPRVRRYVRITDDPNGRGVGVSAAERLVRLRLLGSVRIDLGESLRRSAVFPKYIAALPGTRSSSRTMYANRFVYIFRVVHATRACPSLVWVLSVTRTCWRP